MVNHKGFSYIEVLIALGVSAVIFTSVMPLMFGVINKNRDTKLKLVAYEAALNQVESLRESKIASLCPAALPQITPCDTTFAVPEIPGATGHVYTIKNLNDQKIASVDVVITWTLKNVAQKAEIKTYLYGSTE